MDTLDTYLSAFLNKVSYLISDPETEYQQGITCEEKQNYQEALKHFENAASQSHIFALDKLGQYHLCGKGGISKDIRKADDYFWEVAKLISSTDAAISTIAKYRIGNLHWNKGDFEKAEAFLKVAADSGDSHSQSKYASLLEQLGKSPEAIRYYTFAVKKGGPFAQHNLAFLIEKTNPQHALMLYKEAAKKNSFSLTAVGNCYRDGIGCKQDIDKAIEFYELATTHKDPDPEAFFILACFYGEGRGVEENSKIAIECMTKAADAGYLIAQLALGIYYSQENDEGAQDFPKAIKYYQLAAAQNNPEALYILAGIYQKGIGIEQNLDRVLECLIKAADAGHPEAQFNLGIYYSRNKNPQNLSKSIEYFTKAADEGHPEAQFHLGIYYSQEKNPPNFSKALKYYKLAADQDHPEALINLGCCYQDGMGVEKNLKKAVKYFIKAADFGGDPKVQIMVGDYHREGTKVEKNLKIALYYYTRAANQGNAMAQFKLGLLYLGSCYGEENKEIQDLTKSIKLFKLAGKQDHRDALYYLGACYFFGEGVEKNLEKAVKYYTRAADLGDSEAQFKVGLLCSGNNQQIRDIPKAIKYYCSAASQDHTDALCKLGEYCEKELPHLKERATQYYTKAADLGSSKAQFHLGLYYTQFLPTQQFPLGLYYKGTKQFKKGIEYFQLAAKQGHIGALRILADCLKDGIGVPKDLDAARRLYSTAKELEAKNNTNK